jgi:hypothetical protein
MCHLVVCTDTNKFRLLMYVITLSLSRPVRKKITLSNNYTIKINYIKNKNMIFSLNFCSLK